MTLELLHSPRVPHGRSAFLEDGMIKVTRLNDSNLWINAEMIEFVEATPDTVVSMISHAKIVVKETPEVIVDAVVEYRQRILHQRPQVIERED
jgi:flagellar protein FlbD